MFFSNSTASVFDFYLNFFCMNPGNSRFNFRNQNSDLPFVGSKFESIGEDIKKDFIKFVNIEPNFQTGFTVNCFLLNFHDGG